ncbi:PEP-CTERM sorting domain-containing protein [Nostoc sp. WHI]|uniref:PEP-CTERM sorting domain-containing protein n=1 Tax=Nostoc sp. WHI TaxID=2650611 RepID=UPI0018C75B6C|nr:PEP-CTERM sorting domain-containing protein [Nostoc sp. WHI]MBG1268907.1 PEP-CTERM sorting domain-containing protein [Nostoc sp. WHI]
MKFFNKSVVVTAIALGFGVIGASSSQAASISRPDFNADAVNFDFESTAGGSLVATNGNLSVTNGVVFPIGSVGLVSGNAYYDGADSSIIRFDFLNPVSAFGLDFIANNADITLSIFDNADNLINSLTLDFTTLPALPFPSSFIGLNAGSNSIAYATIDTPLDGNELSVDNLIYQSTAVPEPASMLGLLGVGALGTISGIKRKQKQKAKA